MAKKRIPKSLAELRDSLPESEIQRDSIDLLQKFGYIVKVSDSGINPKAWKALQYAEQNGVYQHQGSPLMKSEGIPDLLITASYWNPGVWLGIELKTKEGKLRKSQAELYEQSRIFVCRSASDVFETVKFFEQSHGFSRGRPRVAEVTK